MEQGCRHTSFGRITAAPAVIPAVRGKSAFTLIEVMIVVIVIGILASLGYASIVDIVFANRAKETAQTMRTFVEKTLTDAKRQGIEVEISVTGNNIIAVNAETKASFSSAHLSEGYTPLNVPVIGTYTEYAYPVASKLILGSSGITEPGYFAACGARGYCGAAVKKTNENFFRAYIKRGTNADWEAL